MSKKSGFMSEFKTFIARGNVMDLAVGVIVGSAFTGIVTSLTNNILMPIIGVVIGGFDFSKLALNVTIWGREVAINYGLFIQSTVDFLLTALCIFIIIKSKVVCYKTVCTPSCPVTCYTVTIVYK
jgi:large conductance mechanosensitive channel